MAQFRGTIRGSRGEASRLGGKDSGINLTADGWDLGVSVRGFHSKITDKDTFDIEVTSGSNGGQLKFKLVSKELTFIGASNKCYLRVEEI